MRTLHLTLTLALLSGCGLSRENHRRDAGADASFVPAEDAGPDAFVPDDSGLDAGVDAFVPDAFVPEPDGGPACECEATSECEVAACVDGVCVRELSEDGLACGELAMGRPSGVCVAGACVARGCGDGFVEPGPTGATPDAPARESCDDGNLSNDDACSSSCTSIPTLVDVSPEGDWEPSFESNAQPRALAVDGAGRVLLVYERSGPGVMRALLGQRFDAAGVRIGEPLMIGTPFLFPSVVGLPSGGWVVAYDRIPVGIAIQAAVFRTVSVDGVVGPERRAGTVELDERQARAFPVGDGFVVTFQRDTMFEERLYARRFTASGMPLGTEILVHSAQQVRWATAAGEGEGDDLRWIVAWQADYLGAPRIEARRFRGDLRFDPTPLEITPSGRNPHASTARAPGTEDTNPDRVRFLVAYHDDTRVAFRPVTMGTTMPPAVVFERSRGATSDNYASVVPRRGPAVGDAPPALLGFMARLERSYTSPALAATVALPTDDLMRLEEAFDAGQVEGNVAIAASPRGTWIAWTDLGPGGALRLFLLPD